MPKACDGPRIAPNRLARNFRRKEPDLAWVTLVTCVRTTAGWLDVAPVIDLLSRGVVGFAMSPGQDASLRLSALSNAIAAASTASRNTSACSRPSASGEA